MLAGCALRAWLIGGESLWRDEVDSIRFALALSPGALREQALQTGFNGPLYLATLRSWFAAIGVSDFSLRAFSLLWGMLLIATVAGLTRRLAGPRAALFAAILIIFSPVHTWYGAEGKMYAMQPALLSAAMLSLHIAIRRASAAGWLLFTILTSCAFYTHILSPLFLPVAALAAIVWGGWRSVLQRAPLLSAAALALPYLPLLAWQLPALLAGVSTGHPSYSTETIVLSLLLNWSHGLNLQLPWSNAAAWPLVAAFWLLWLLIVLAPLMFGWQAKPDPARYCFSTASAGALHRLGPNQRFWHTTVLLAWLLLPIALLMLIQPRIQLFEPRYVLWCAPALAVLGGMGIAAWPRWFAAGVTTLLVLLQLLGVAAQQAHVIRPDQRAAATALVARLLPEDALVYQIPYGAHSFRHYGVHAVREIDGPFVNGGEQVDATLRAALGPSQRVWLVETEVEMWDAANQTRAWFEANWRPGEMLDFHGVRLSAWVRRR